MGELSIVSVGMNRSRRNQNEIAGFHPLHDAVVEGGVHRTLGNIVEFKPVVRVRRTIGESRGVLEQNVDPFDDGVVECDTAASVMGQKLRLRLQLQHSHAVQSPNLYRRSSTMITTTPSPNIIFVQI
ncbi:hypothetical protein [Paenibacillus alba]|uniref:Uncharacterized protein n=1 Tax=Paenibacillus alba TaxID=1197127 RepID=A0ABU6GD82_9BACL|nr:hypothetical protein [Paenibacillus alba]MEC0231207.1 hypothetical protein [Paenibacillus alba]